MNFKNFAVESDSDGWLHLQRNMVVIYKRHNAPIPYTHIICVLLISQFLLGTFWLSIEKCDECLFCIQFSTKQTHLKGTFTTGHTC